MALIPGFCFSVVTREVAPVVATLVLGASDSEVAEVKPRAGSGWGSIRFKSVYQHLYPQDKGEPGPDVSPPYSDTEQVRRQAFLELMS